MSDYYGTDTLESWLENEVYGREAPPPVVALFERWREEIESSVRSWMESDADGEGNPYSWRGWGRGYGSIAEAERDAAEAAYREGLTLLDKAPDLCYTDPMPKTTKTPNAAEAFITVRRRAYPSLFWTDDDVLLDILARTAHDVVWDVDGNIKELGRGVDGEKDSFTDEGWKYMDNASYGRMRTSWQEPAHSSPFCQIPDNISAAWESKLSHLCYCIERIKDEAMLTWITTHYEFQSIGAEYKQAEIDRNYGAYLKVKAALALTAQRLRDINTAKQAEASAKVKPWQVAPSVVVHHKECASTETAIVVSVASMPTGVNEVTVVAVLDRPLRGSVVIRVSDLTPLTHPTK